MWWTQEGARVLKGAEGALFRETLAWLWEEIDLCNEIDEEHRVGIKVFDTLTVGQRLIMLVEVGEALISEAVPVPELTAVNEATVAAVFSQLRLNVELELDDPAMGGEWRGMIFSACEEAGMVEYPDEGCDDLEEWDPCIASLRDRILWDADYEDDRLLDDPPELRKTLSGLMGNAPAMRLLLPCINVC